MEDHSKELGKFLLTYLIEMEEWQSDKGLSLNFHWKFFKNNLPCENYLDLFENDFVLKILDQGEELSLAFFENFKMGPIFVSSSILHFKKHENCEKKCE